MRTEIETPRLVIDLLILRNFFSCHGTEEKRGEIIPHPRYLGYQHLDFFWVEEDFFGTVPKEEGIKITKRFLKLRNVFQFPMYSKELPRISPHNYKNKIM